MNSLPASLRLKLDELARRTRQGQRIQGVCRVSLILAILAVCIILLDAQLDLSRWLRVTLFFSWLAIGAGLWKMWLRNPLRAPLDQLGLAALVEKQYPRLGERLLTAVELAEHPESANGSSSWMNQLLGDADHRTKSLDFTTTVPLRGYWTFAGFSLVALALMLTPLYFIENSAGLIKRFALPWRDPALDAGFRIVITSGETGVPRGANLVLSGYFEPTKSKPSFPQNAQLVVRLPDGQIDTQAVTIEKENVFFANWDRANFDFEYRIESGPVKSEWYRVHVVEPLEIIGGLTEISPPAYTRKTGEPTPKVSGLGDLQAIQYSTIEHHIQFNRAPIAATLEWTPEDQSRSATNPAKITPLDIQNSSVVLQSRALQPGSYRLHVEAEYHVMFDWPAQPLRVKVDLPPKFTQASGFTDQTRTVRPDEVIGIGFALLDDFGLGKAFLEYRINQKDSIQQEIPLKLLNPAQGEAQYRLDLRGKVKDGDTIEYRLIAFDNRDLPEEKLGPQRSVYPPGERWAELRISNSADPLDEQEIETRRKSLDEKIQSVVRDLENSFQGTQRLRNDSSRQRSLNREQSEKLREIREKTGDNRSALDTLAQEIEVIPDLAALKQGLREVSSESLNNAEASLAEAQKTPGEPRREKFDAGMESIAQAIQKLEKLRKLNDKLAAEQRTRQKVDRLGQEERQLSEQAKTSDPAKLTELDARQREIQEKLQRLVADNEDLRNALKAGDNSEVNSLMTQLQALAENLKSLLGAQQEALKEERGGKLSDLAQRQSSLASRIDDFVRRTETTVRSNRLAPLSSTSARKAESDLMEGRPSDAFDNQVRSALEIEKFAQKLAEAADKVRDPREAARQLAEAQDFFRKRLAEETQKKNFDELPADKQNALLLEQKSINEAIAALKLPSDAASPLQERKQASEKAQEAVDRLQKKAKRSEVDDSLQKASDALRRLAEKLPSLGDRIAQARKNLTTMRNELETLSRQTDLALRPLEKQPHSEKLNREASGKLVEQARKLEKLQEALNKLDLPENGDRIQKAKEAAKRAWEDLKAGRVQDIAGSQQTLRRELDRLDQASAGMKTPEQQVAELAKQQKDLSEKIDLLSKKPRTEKEDWARLGKEQSDIIRKLQAQNIGEEPRGKEDALTLSRKTEQNLNEAKVEEARKSSLETEEHLQRLAERMANPEEAALQAKRLSKTQLLDAESLEKPSARKLSPQAMSEQKKQLQSAIDELRQIPGGDEAAAEKQKTLEKLQEALSQNPNDLAKARKEAAEAAKKFADKLHPTTASEPKPESKAENSGALPQKAQAEEARKLAQEQKQLSDDTLRRKEAMKNTNPEGDKNPLKEIIAKQKAIGEQAETLANGLGKAPMPNPDIVDQAKQAKQAAQDTAKELSNGRITPAKEQARNAKTQFEKLLEEPEAKKLAQKEQEIIAALEKLDSKAGPAQQADRLEELRQRSNELQKKFQDLTQRTAEQPEIQKSAQSSQEATQQAAKSMTQAQKLNREDQPETALKAMQEALQNLETAVKQHQAKIDPHAESMAQAGQSLNDARKQMENAHQELVQKTPAKAESSMKQAADSLQNAARQMRVQQPQQTPSSVTENRQGPPAGGAPVVPRGLSELKNISPEAAKHSGKAWGDLPGEVQAKILQDMRAHYGEDYANKIRYYFETISERK